MNFNGIICEGNVYIFFILQVVYVGYVAHPSHIVIYAPGTHSLAAFKQQTRIILGIVSDVCTI